MSELPNSSPDALPAIDKENRLVLIQREALAFVPSGVSPAPRASAKNGYYELPMLKEPSWTWEIPLYFFVGGAAGGAGVIATVAQFSGASPDLVWDARRLSLAGAFLSPVLLISDLGRPERFLAMLRVFKPQSPMSVGVWVLMGFSAGTSTANLGEWLAARGRFETLAKLMQIVGDLGALVFGLPLATYTGVLIGATVIPVWNRNVSLLPVHFAASGLNAAVGLLEIAGHRTPALQWLGMGSAIAETGIGVMIETRSDPAEEPLKRGPSGWLIRLGGVLSGPVPLALRAISLFSKRGRASKLRRYAAISSVVGSAITRAAWIHAGHVSARQSRPA